MTPERMRDQDELLKTPGLEFGSGVIGVCDICGKRQAVIVLQKERFKLCVIDFLNKTWLRSDRTPGAPLPVYRSDRVWFPTKFAPEQKAPAIVLSPTKIVKHPVLLITPDVYGLTTAVLDAAIRFAREGFEVLLPDVGKTSSVGPASHLALRTGTAFRGGVPISSSRVKTMLQLYADALAYLRAREMVDPSKTGLFGLSYGGSLALALAAQVPNVSAVALAYPMPVVPANLAAAVDAPILVVAGSTDRMAQKAAQQIVAARSEAPSRVTIVQSPGVGHNFLARDMSAYALAPAEHAWTSIVGFLQPILIPPPPRPPAPPVRPTTPPAAAAVPKTPEAVA